MSRLLSWTAVAGLFASLASPVFADLLVLKDGNIIELTGVKEEKRSLQSGTSPQACYVGKNERGVVEVIPKTNLAQGGWIMQKTSWEKRADNRAWYEKESAKVKDDFKAQAAFAVKCSADKMSHDLDDEADKHFKKAYELELPTINKDDDKNLEIFAKKVRDDYGLYDEATTVFRSLLALRKTALVTKGATAPGFVALGKQAKDLELWTEAQEYFDEALKLDDKNAEAKKQIKELKRDLEVPMNMPMFRMLNGSFNLGVKYVKSKQEKEGWFGGDFTEAGVHGRRGISGVCTSALFFDYQLQKRKAMDKEKAAELPKELDLAIRFLMQGEEGMGTEGRLEGDDMWGAIFAAEALVMCATDEYIMSRYGEEMKAAIHKHIDRLKTLQRRDGGWYYYNFVPDSSSFSTASTLIILETLKNMGAEKDLCDSMVPGAIGLIKKMKQGRGTYKYMEMGTTYHSASSPLGASARSPLCEFALHCAEASDPDDYRQAVSNWINNVHLLKRIKGREGTHIGKGMTAPYYFLYSHMYMARAVKVYPKAQANKLMRIVGSLMLSYQEPDGAWTDWKLPTDNIHKFRVSQTAMGLITLWHLMTGDRDPAILPLRGGGMATNKGTETESGGSGKKKDDGGANPEGGKPKDPPKDPPKDEPKKPMLGMGPWED
ncbi:MAG TPA: prenyltransferase/squalene oxidase repeat-containing protein [Planctomycetota bacterium]|nr:prenyltransferase/squalene oxidase repeat-containing protein [Planctomycetota bacterium]